MSTQTIEGLTTAIAATQDEIEQLQARLAELATLPPAPGATASHKERTAHRLEVAQLQSDRLPEIEGTTAAIKDLEDDLKRDQAALAQAQAAQTQQIRQARVAAARLRIDELGEKLAGAVGEVASLLTEIHQAISDVDDDYRALQTNPHPRPAGGYNVSDRFYRWTPQALPAGRYLPDSLPVLFLDGDRIGTASKVALTNAQMNAERDKRDRQRMLEAFRPKPPEQQPAPADVVDEISRLAPQTPA